jgi:hypothetical protein
VITPVEHAPAFPHDAIQEIADDVFAVRGSLLMNPLIRISRNMAVVRYAGELSLINPIRLSESGIDALQRLGRIRRIIALGALHGIDNAWYREHFGVESWARPGSQKYPPPADNRLLDEREALPFPDAQLFCFHGTQPESAVLLRRGRGLLLTCVAIQHYGDYRHTSPAAKLLLPLLGFPKTTLVGPIWLKAVTTPGGTMRGDFERLLRLKFDSLFAAHGSFLPEGAHAAVEVAVHKAFG